MVGTILGRSIIEIAGRPKEHVEDTLKKYIEKLKTDPDMQIKKEIYAPAAPLQGDSMFSAFVDIEILFKDLPTLTGFCFDYMPSSVEIIEPVERLLKNEDLTHLYNDLQANLHKVDMGAKLLRMDKEKLATNFIKLIENFITILIAKTPKDKATVASYIGIKEEDVEFHLNKMVNEGKVQKTDDKYGLKHDKTQN